MTHDSISSIRDRVYQLYETGLPAGQSTGWKCLDRHYTVELGQWTLVTGIPHSGKSEWLDALMVNLASLHKWQFVIYSPENHPLELHTSKILEKKIGKPFGQGPHERMTHAELEAGLKWMEPRFRFLKLQSNSLEELLQVSTHYQAVGTYRQGVIVDPWNTLEHRRPKDKTVTEWVSEQLSWIINFTRTYNAHMWLVAHPKKIEKEYRGKAPTPYDISDSAHFYNKADNIICVHRNQSEESQTVEIHVQKCRFKHIGRIGQIDLNYDRITGRYHEIRTDHAIAHYYERES